MNLFLLHLKRKTNARMHCNRHVVKMVLETTQLLWTAVWMGGTDMTRFEMTPYRKTHVWHPTSIWVRESPKNWAYALAFGLQLCKEYTRRYHKHHKCEAHLRYLRRLGYFPPVETREIKKQRGDMGNGCTPFPLAMPEECMLEGSDGRWDPVRSYSKYYEMKRAEWKTNKRPMKWEPREPKGPKGTRGQKSRKSRNASASILVDID